MSETVEGKEHKYSSCLKFVADISNNRVKHPYFPKQNLKYTIEKYIIDMNIFCGII